MKLPAFDFRCFERRQAKGVIPSMLNLIERIWRPFSGMTEVTVGAPIAAVRSDRPKLAAEARTSTGKVRRINEDAILSRTDLALWAVADGVGGHDAGDLASSMLVEKLQGGDPGQDLDCRTAALRRLIEGHHEYLYDLGIERGGRTIASTVVVLTIAQWRYSVLWAGDSRAYLWRAKQLIRLSRDHSLVQELVDRGDLRQEMAESHPQSNVITSAVGSGERLWLDEVAGDLLPDDIFILCSDGLTRMVSEESIGEVLVEKYPPLIADELIDRALNAGGRDNVSVIVVRCRGE